MKEILKFNNIKSTKYRIAILKILIEEKERFISIDEIHEKIKFEHNSFDFSTAYRALELFEEKKIIYRTKYNEKIYYTYKCSEEEFHHHLICKTCGKKTTLDFCPFITMESKYFELGFKSFEHTRDFFGQCNECI